MAPLALGWYNASIPEAIGARIKAQGRAGQNAFALLIGNSRTLWEPFVEACAAEGLLELDNPLDRYLDTRLCGALEACAAGLSYRVYWSHRRTADLEGGPDGVSEHVAFQRMAHHAGLAYLDETSHLCLHPRFGPWFSLRCVVIFDDLPYTLAQPQPLPNPLPVATQQYVALTLHTAVHNTSHKYQLPKVDVEAAEAVLSETSCERLLEGDSDEEEGQGGEEASLRELRPVRRPSSSARSTRGSSEGQGCSGGTTPTCSSGCSSPRARVGSDAAPEAALTPEGLACVAAARLAAQLAAQPLPVPAQGQRRVGSGGFGSPLQVGSPDSASSRRSASELESKPSMRAVAANWRAWVAVRDAPCPGHPWRYSEEQLTYHYTRDRNILVKALLRRNLGPASPMVPASGLLDPALQSFHKATMQAHNKGAVRVARLASAADVEVPTPTACAAPSPLTAA